MNLVDGNSRKPKKAFGDDVVKSLEKICFNFIKKHLGRFVKGDENNSDILLQRDLLFLQRRYSKELVSDYSQLGVKPKFLTFLMNEHLNEVYLEHFRRCSVQDILAQMQKMGKSVHTFHVGKMYHCLWEREEKLDMISKILVCIPNVVELSFSETCTNEIMKIVSSCSKLKKLSLYFCEDLTEEGFEHLCLSSERGGMALKYFNVYTKEDLNLSIIKNVLSRVSSLETFDLQTELAYPMYQIHKMDILDGTLDSLPGYNLTKFDALMWEPSDNMLRDLFIILSTLCLNVKELSTFICEGENLEYLAKLSNLRRLRIESSSMDKIVRLKSIPDFKSLEHISLTGVSVYVSSLLDSCSLIESLELHAFTFKKNLVSVDKKYFVNLKELCFGSRAYCYDCYKTDTEELDALLNACLKLKLVSLSNFEFTEDTDDSSNVLTKFASKNTLQEFNIRVSNVKPAFLEKLMLCCKSLRTMLIDCCWNIKPKDMAPIYAIAEKNDVIIKYTNGYSIPQFLL